MNNITIITLMTCCIVLLMQAFFVQKNEEFRGPFDIRMDIAARAAFCFLALQAFACAIWLIVK